MMRRFEAWYYGLGDLGFNFVWQSIELYLLFYYIRGLGIAPAVASGIFLAGAAVDWLTDPLIGAVADRLAPRVPLRAWVSIGGPLSVLLLCLAFAPPPVPAAWVPGYALVTYLALRFAYGLGNIPYGALTARLSPDPADHLRLTGARMQGAALGGLIAALTYALLPADRSGGADFRLGALILAGLAMPAFFATSFGTTERVVPRAASTRRLGGAIAAMAALLVRSTALRRLMVTILLVGLTMTLINKSLLFLFDQINARRLGYYVALVPALSLLLTAPLWARLALRAGQVDTLRIAAVALLAMVVLALAGRGVAPALVCITLAIVAGQGMSVMFWSLVPATVAACEREDVEGGYAVRVYAMATIARKLAQAIAPQAIAIALYLPDGALLVAIALVAALTMLAAVFYPPLGPEAERAAG
ncbi:MFS transporter [Sphingomonas glacialis]|uniref:Sugar transporter n=1 Tax=Sphingomonas glacialis TaxID=658225 RepID=A0A502FVI9_9SPHN|nr:MFS transporter [Sphingomonas glacialis]TPG52973.1 sugar transporter [Sphingomonas glacialis]